MVVLVMWLWSRVLLVEKERASALVVWVSWFCLMWL